MEPLQIPPIPEPPENHLVRADTGKRFLNYIIDLAIFYVFFIFMVACFTIFFPSTMDAFVTDEGLGSKLADRLLTLLSYSIYMSFLEAILQGRSFGKMITKTRAVNWDGSPISTGMAIARGFSRAVPFCVLSAFGNPCNPWQDRWTDTMVIDERKSEFV